MTQDCTTLSTITLKRQSTENETDFAAKKSKLNEPNPKDDSNVETQSQQLEQSNADFDERKSVPTKLVSLILSGQCRYVQIYPSQMVWCRVEKSPFWPAMVWPSKSGKITDDKRRKVLLNLFGKKSANVWIKLENVFPFDGLESFEKMKHSVNVQGLTVILILKFDKLSTGTHFSICTSEN